MNSPALGDDSPLYFEDIPLGQVFRSTGRTITEADIVAFAGLSADYNPLHVDAHYAAATPLGGRVAHGLLVLSITTGLTTRLPITRIRPFGWMTMSLTLSMLPLTTSVRTRPSPSNVLSREPDAL